jgi:lysophospholipase L1-like esterase
MTPLRRLFPCGLAVLGLLAAVPAFAAEPVNRHWEKDIAAIEQREAAAPSPSGGILFTGSSSIVLWKTLAADFPGLPVINRGFGGSEISDLIGYFGRIVKPGAPRLIVIYSGTNDLTNHEAPEQVFADLATLCGMISRELPSTKIAYIAVAPNPARWAQREAQRKLNALAAAYCARNGHTFIDVWTPMLGDDGLPSRDLYVADKLHMNAAGYALWTRVVGPYLR